jgi:hypothetical protein
MGYTKEQIETWKHKAEKWDTLDEKIGQYYEYDESGEPLYDEDEADLLTIDEVVVPAFRYL